MPKDYILCPFIWKNTTAEHGIFYLHPSSILYRLTEIFGFYVVICIIYAAYCVYMELNKNFLSQRGTTQGASMHP